MWDWQGEDYGMQANASNSLWSNLNENQDDLSYVFDETTPVKSFGDLAYQVTDIENINKEIGPCREAHSQAKRRRMLHFDDEVLDVDVMPLCDEDLSSTYLKGKEREASLDGALSDMTQWVAGFADDTSATGSGYEGLDQSSEGWLADCLINDTEMHLSPDDVNPSGTIAVEIDLAGKKSLIKTPPKMTSSVVLPFAFVKPCGMQGAVTLKDINQKILTPPPSKSKKTHQDPTTLYPTSAFSGKPVVGKTKIHTEGGKGSITIMRTKG